MFDDVVRTLYDVRYVPKLRRNLISVGVLDSNGFCYKFESGIMKVSKGVMTVMKAHKTVGNIYRLLGITVVGGATSIEFESDSTIL